MNEMFWMVHVHDEEDYTHDNVYTFDDFEQALTKFHLLASAGDNMTHLWITVHTCAADLQGMIMVMLTLNWNDEIILKRS